MTIEEWNAGRPLGLNVPDDLLGMIDDLPRGSKTRFLLGMLSLGFDPEAEPGVEFLLQWVDQVKRGKTAPDPAGLAKEFARRVLADEPKKRKPTSKR